MIPTRYLQRVGNDRLLQLIFSKNSVEFVGVNLSTVHQIESKDINSYVASVGPQYRVMTRVHAAAITTYITAYRNKHESEWYLMPAGFSKWRWVLAYDEKSSVHCGFAGISGKPWHLIDQGWCFPIATLATISI